MKYSRRDLSLLLAALATGEAAADGTALASGTFDHDALPARTNGPNQVRPILQGQTHTGTPIELHETELAPGQAPHPPHHHVHEEMLMIRDGTLEVTIGDKKTNLGPGSAAYVASNEHHGWRNVGTSRAKYFVLALGRDA
jgi:mannose-6-phosphate isomerase-like protein (cupin superfamily)